MITFQSVVQSHGLLSVSFSRRPWVRAVHCDAVVEINKHGQWVNGIEIYTPPFDLSRAVEWMSPTSPGEQDSPGCVTYDSEADAAYLYLLYRNASPARRDDSFRIADSRELEVEWRLAADGSLVEFVIPSRQLESFPSDFAALLRSDRIEDLPDK